MTRSRSMAGLGGAAALVAAGALALVPAAAAQRAGAGALADPWLSGPLQAHARLGGPINAGDAGSLHAAWRIPTREPVSGTPIVTGGRAYFTTWSDSVYAADARSGRVVWRRTIGRPQERWPWHGLAATGALVGGTLYEASVEGRLYALDARTGRVRWQRRITRQRFAGVLADLQYAGGRLYVGLSSVAEPMAQVLGGGYKPKFRGEVLAVDPHGGRVVWRTALVQPPMNGVAVWGGAAVDVRAGRLYVATGNNYSGRPSAMSDSMIALSTRTGRVLWVDQTFKHDVWLPTHPIGPDWDYGAAPQLFSVRRNGSSIPAVGAGDKAGLYIAFDRRTGRPLWHVEVGNSNGEGIRWEGSLGRGVIYIASNLDFADESPAHYRSRVRALDMDSGRTIWVRRFVQAGKGADAGFLARDVFFVGDETGGLAAYDGRTGATLAYARAAGPIASSINAWGRMIYVGTGIPTALGGGPGLDGVQAFAVR